MVSYSQKTTILQEAEQFIGQCYEELGITPAQAQQRLDEIEQEIEQTGTYIHTQTELAHGAKMTWRNSNRCIGRLFWQTLHVFDCRHLTTAEEAFEALQQHIQFATNEGKIRSTITVFSPQSKLKLWNHQLLRYAGYEVNGEIIGDATSIKLTKKCLALGWNSQQTPYDILPLVIEEEGKEPVLFDIPQTLIKEVVITHPTIEEFATLNMKWYSVPMIADMRLEIGGIEYSLAPFNGWYMGTEIGARNLADEDRYNFLPQIAQLMQLQTKSSRSLWQDKALVELNIAVLHSFQEAGVTLVDHHTAAKQFKVFEKNEESAGRNVTGNWTWLIPPLSPATTHIYHQPYNNEIKKPNYFYPKK